MAHYHWLKYSRSGKIVEIIIRDDGGGKLDVFKFNSTDEKAIKKAVKTIKEKYNINFSPEVSKKPDKDLDWLK